jgi:hypothetical protein
LPSEKALLPHRVSRPLSFSHAADSNADYNTK